MGITMILDYLKDFNLVSIVLRFVMAGVLGGFIGATRGRGQHAAGMRTYFLVSVGACSVVLMSIYVNIQLGNSGDILRMPAQVISGIGFLGAGSIIVTGKSTVRGLTTAAGLWASACMGLACGAGFYAGAVIMFALIYIGLVTLVKVDQKHIRTYKVLTVFMEIDPDAHMSTLLKGLDDIGLEMRTIERFGHSGDAFSCYKTELDVVKPDGFYEDEIDRIRAIPGVLFAEEIRG